MRYLVAAAMITAAACSQQGLGVTSYEECALTFSAAARDEAGTRSAASMCRELFRPETSSDRKEFIGCALPRVRDSGNRLGVRVAYDACYKLHPAARALTPPAG